MERLVTLGYEGASLEAFIATLREAGVDVVVDVREAPTSRRPEFARRALRAAVEQARIAYRHEGRLGAPKPLRDRLKQDRDYQDFFERYAEHLAGNEAVLDALARELDGGAALMCYEREYRVCHRRLVADALAERAQVTPQHLVPPRGG